MYKSKLICILNSLRLKMCGFAADFDYDYCILRFLIWLREGNTLLIPRGKCLVSIIKLLITLCISGGTNVLFFSA